MVAANIGLLVWLAILDLGADFKCLLKPGPRTGLSEYLVPLLSIPQLELTTVHTDTLQNLNRRGQVARVENRQRQRDLAKVARAVIIIASARQAQLVEVHSAHPQVIDAVLGGLTITPINHLVGDVANCQLADLLCTEDPELNLHCVFCWTG